MIALFAIAGIAQKVGFESTMLPEFVARLVAISVTANKFVETPQATTLILHGQWNKTRRLLSLQ